ncbi:MAG TPA: phosphopantetheine-binding protein [Flavobacteriaceae bacterium]|nr:phosphopantetheine-binding protein [Flavobacteriaceae bacterium]
MEREEIIKTANTFLVEEFEVDKSTLLPEANLRETLGLDSLDYVDLVVIIESHFGVKLGEQDFVGLVTFDDFYTCIENKMESKKMSL